MIDFRLYAISNRQLRPDLAAFANEAAAFGLRAFQLREHDITTRELMRLARDVRSTAPSVQLFVNDRPDVASVVHGTGIQAPEAGWPVERLRENFSNAMIGKSTHSLAAAVKAQKDGADFVLFGPVFETPSKRALGIEPRGLPALEAVSDAITIPVFAVGGITPERALHCRAWGAHGVAVMSDLLVARDIEHRLLEYELALGGL